MSVTSWQKSHKSFQIFQHRFVWFGQIWRISRHRRLNISSFACLRKLSKIKLSCTDRVHAVSYADDGIKIIEFGQIVLPIRSSCRDFLGNWIFYQFSTGKAVFQMQPDVVCRTVEQHPHRLLRTPHSLVLVVHFNALFLPLYLKDEELRRAVSNFSTFYHILFVHFYNST